MNKSLIVGVVSVALLSSSMATMADDHGWSNYQGAQQHSQQRPSPSRPTAPQWNNHNGPQWNNRPSSNWNSPSRYDHGYRYDQRRYQSGGYRYQPNAYYGNGYNQRVVYHVGERLPDYYRSSHYYVNDWRGYHLHEPPRGYGWANIDGNFVLVALATGLIAQVLLNGGY